MGCLTSVKTDPDGLGIRLNLPFTIAQYVTAPPAPPVCAVAGMARCEEKYRKPPGA